MVLPALAAMLMGRSSGLSEGALDAARSFCAVAWLLVPPMAEACSCALSRKPKRAAAARALRAAEASLMEQGALMMGAIALLLAFCARAAASWSMREAWRARVGAASARWGEGFHGYAARRAEGARRLREEGLDGLTEAGAWRLARRAMGEGRPELAARAWAERPFNPSWRMGTARVRASASRARMAPGASFARSIEFAASAVADAGKERYLRRVAELARSASESRQIAGAVERASAPSRARGRL